MTNPEKVRDFLKRNRRKCSATIASERKQALIVTSQHDRVDSGLVPQGIQWRYTSWSERCDDRNKLATEAVLIFEPTLPEARTTLERS